MLAVWGLFFWVICGRAMNVISPPNLARHVPSPFLCASFGNPPANVSVMAEAVYIKDPRNFNPKDVSGKVVIAPGVIPPLSLSESERLAFQLGHYGAVAVVAVLAAPVPGSSSPLPHPNAHVLKYFFL